MHLLGSPCSGGHTGGYFRRNVPNIEFKIAILEFLDCESQNEDKKIVRQFIDASNRAYLAVTILGYGNMRLGSSQYGRKYLSLHKEVRNEAFSLPRPVRPRLSEGRREPLNHLFPIHNWQCSVVLELCHVLSNGPGEEPRDILEGSSGHHLAYLQFELLEHKYTLLIR